ncbi:MAG: hypothetical protein KatS3mg125_0539 [Lysobacterales bacterium]|jgi:hypothetical protein|nr:MAG: hypothetical protein KatS3mg125_0539 [Xanthomonadales bacterium]
MRLLWPALSSVLLCACAFVNPDERGREVEVAYFGVQGQCQLLGEVSAHVPHRIAGIERSEIRVRDELESLARNEAAELGADTIEPVGEPERGRQSFRAYRCR